MQNAALGVHCGIDKGVARATVLGLNVVDRVTEADDRIEAEVHDRWASALEPGLEAFGTPYAVAHLI